MYLNNFFMYIHQYRQYKYFKSIPIRFCFLLSLEISVVLLTIHLRFFKCFSFQWTVVKYWLIISLIKNTSISRGYLAPQRNDLKSLHWFIQNNKINIMSRASLQWKVIIKIIVSFSWVWKVNTLILKIPSAIPIKQTAGTL